jgi:hypothetical protein
MKPLIEVRVADDEFDYSSPGKESGVRLSKILDDEVARFDAWMSKYLNGETILMEKAILKTYLYRKIKQDIDSLESVPVDIIGLVIGK